MIETGKWSGYYSFSDKEVSRIRGFEKTNFEIEILSVRDNAFTGHVQDDKKTGGMEGVGEISGMVHGDKVEFVKRMPVMTLLVDRNGTKKTLPKKHRPIYYSGQFAADRKSISGTWRFKFGFIWMGFLPVPVRPSKGIWSMRILSE